MLTPSFELRQKDDELLVDIRAPYAKISELDVFFEDFDFKFFCKPYFLRLNLPGKVVYQEEPSVKYDYDKGIFTISMPKAVPGEIFEGLDLLTKLLAPKYNRNEVVPKIEIVGEVDHNDDVEENFDWEVDQEPAEFQECDVSLEKKCGFASLYPCTVLKLKEETSEIFDFNPSSFENSQRIRNQERLSLENDQFSEDHYLGDLYEDEEIKSLLKFKADWETVILSKKTDKIVFTSEEKERLTKLPNKEYILEKNEKKYLLLGLVDILFAYAYNKRITEGENTVESAWTVNKLSATLSWMEVFNSVPELLHSCVRRSLIYPLFRHWELAMKSVEDTKTILSLGRRYVLKCLLEIHELFCNTDPRYLLNDLFITDYCVWLQTKCCNSSTLLKLSGALENVHLQKDDIGLEILELEHAAKLVLSEKLCDAAESLAEDVSKISLSESSKVNPDTCLRKESLHLTSDSSTSSSDSDALEVVKSN